MRHSKTTTSEEADVHTRVMLLGNFAVGDFEVGDGKEELIFLSFNMLYFCSLSVYLVTLCVL